MNSATDNGFPSGWLYFAGTILGLAGLMRFVDAFWAFRYDGVLPDEFEGALLGTTLSTYGWAYIIVGVILILSSFAVLNRSQFARWIGIIAGAILTVSAMWWMPVYPVWSLAYVIIGILVIMRSPPTAVVTPTPDRQRPPTSTGIR